MQVLESYFLSLPPDQILFMLGSLIILTCLSLVPNNNDLTQMVAGVMAGFGYLSIQKVFVICLFSVVIGETSMFAVGFFFGKYFLNINFVQKFITPNRVERVKNLIAHNPFLFFLGLRIAPLLRALSIFTLGSIQIDPKLYLKYHLPFSIVYSSMLTLISYYFSNYVRLHFDNYKFYIMGLVVLIWLVILRKIFNKFSSFAF